MIKKKPCSFSSTHRPTYWIVTFRANKPYFPDIGYFTNKIISPSQFIGFLPCGDELNLKCGNVKLIIEWERNNHADII